MDSTTIIYYTCMHCNERFRVKKDNGRHKFCCDEHRVLFHKDRNLLKQQLKETIRKELEKAAKSKTVLSKMNKFYQILGMEDSICGICGTTLDENIIKHKVPLHMEVQDPQIRDYRLLDKDSWLTFCTDHYLEIMTLRKQDTTPNN